jgi:hypothetical protein
MSEMLRLSIPGTAPRALALRAGRLAYAEERSVLIVDRHGTRHIRAAWAVDDCQLAANGQFVAAIGDDGKRAAVWNAETGERLHEATGLPHRRQSLRAGVALADVEPVMLVAPFNQPISIVALRDGRERTRLATIGSVWFHALGFVELDPGWIAVRGHLDGEQYDSVAVISWAKAMSDVDSLQVAMTERETPKEWGYQLAIGPAGQDRAVFFRDAEWGNDDPPDDPAESFCGFVIWDLRTKTVEQRIPLQQAMIRTPTAVGADAGRVAIAIDQSIVIIDRKTATMTSTAALALDPYRMEAAHYEPGTIVVKPI